MGSGSWVSMSYLFQFKDCNVRRMRVEPEDSLDLRSIAKSDRFTGLCHG